MKFKTLIALFLIIPTQFLANSTTSELMRLVAQTSEYVQQNKAKIAKTTAGTLTLTTGSFLTGLVAYGTYKKPNKEPGVAFLVSCFSVPATYCGYHTLNDALNNRPNETIKSFIQKAKAQFQKLTVNVQK